MIRTTVNNEVAVNVLATLTPEAAKDMAAELAAVAVQAEEAAAKKALLDEIAAAPNGTLYRDEKTGAIFQKAPNAFGDAVLWLVSPTTPYGTAANGATYARVAYWTELYGAEFVRVTTASGEPLGITGPELPF